MAAKRRATNTRFLLGALAIGWFLTLGTRFVLPAILPQIKATFTISNTTAGITITVIWATYGLMQLPSGMLVDRFDERTILSLSLFLAGISVGILGLAPVFGVFLAATGVFGLATGLFGTSRGLALSRFFRTNPGRAFGFTLAAGSIGSATLPFIATRITEISDWRLALVGFVPVFLIMAVVMYRYIPPQPPTPTPTDNKGDILTIRETLRDLATDRRIIIASIGMTLMLFTYQALTAFLPLYLIEEKGLTQSTASTVFAVLFISAAGFRLLLGSVSDNLGTRPVILSVSIFGIFTLAALPWTFGVIPIAILTVLIATRAAFGPVMNEYMIAALPDTARGTKWGLLRAIFFIIGAGGSTVVGVFTDYGLFDEAFYLLGGITAVAAVSFIFLPPRVDRRDTPPGPSD